MDGYAVRSADVAGVPVELRRGRRGGGRRGLRRRARSGRGDPDHDRRADAGRRRRGRDGRGHRATRRRPPACASARPWPPGRRCAASATTSAPATSCSARAPSITPAVAGVLASVNVRASACTRRARVAVLSTGDELVDDGRRCGPGQIRESNQTMLLALVAEAGVEAVDLGIVRDDEAALERRAARRGRRVRRDRHQRRGQHGRLRRGQGGAVADRRHALDAGGHPAGQAVRVRPARRRRRPSGARVRPAGQPGQLARQLRAVRPAGAAQDDGAARSSTARASRPSPTSRCVAVPTARPTAAGAAPRSGRRPIARRRRSTPRAATSWRRRALADALVVLARRRRRRPGGEVAVSSWYASAASDVHSLMRWISSTPSVARCATCASRSPTAATSAAPTACRRRACTWLPRSEVLTFEEIVRLAAIFVERFEVDGIRLTGGEPTVRAHLPVLVAKLAALRVPRRRRRRSPAQAGSVDDDQRGDASPRWPTTCREAGLRPGEHQPRHAAPRPLRGDDPARRARPGARRHRRRHRRRVLAGEDQRRRRARRQRRRDRRPRRVRSGRAASRCGSSSSCRSTPTATG